MTERCNALTVYLTDETSVDDVEFITAAIQMIRGVMLVRRDPPPMSTVQFTAMVHRVTQASMR